ncbi:MAG: hypothetical protein ABIS50_24320 [Luteolibacter sp.]
MNYKERLAALISLGNEIGTEIERMRESCAKAEKLRMDLLKLLDSMDALG